MTSLRPNKANLTLSSVYDRPGTTYFQPTTTSNDLHSDLSTTKQTYPCIILWPWSTCYDLLSTYYNLKRPPQRPLFDQPNLCWRHPPSIIDLLRPLMTNCQRIIHCQPTSTSDNLYSNSSLWQAYQGKILQFLQVCYNNFTVGFESNNFVYL